MRKAASRKKKSGIFPKLFMGPSAAIIAALVGGSFTLTSALLPRLLPSKEKAPERQQENVAPQAMIAHDLPSLLAPPEHRPPNPAVLEIRVAPSAPAPSPQHVQIESPALKPAPVERRFSFEAKTLESSLADAEAKVPAQSESPRQGRRTRPNLTYGVWTIFASRDARGTTWNHSTLKITSQRDTSDGLRVAGVLDWRANGRCAGREYVVGNYVDETRCLYLQGRSSSGCDRHLALSAASARLSSDGRRLTDGVWGSASARRPAIPGRWEAQR